MHTTLWTFAALALVAGLSLYAAGCQDCQTGSTDSEPAETQPAADAESGQAESQPAETRAAESETQPAEAETQPAEAEPEPAEPEGNPTVVIETSMGDITATLFRDKAPITVENFLRYARDDFFQGTIFHRVIPDFMIQGGGLTSQMQKKATRAEIKNEAGNGLKNRRGTLAMARTNDPDSASSQFFINLKDNAFLNRSPGNHGYAVFGEVTDGMDVVDKIAETPTTTVGGRQDVPRQPIVIEDVRVVE